MNATRMAEWLPLRPCHQTTPTLPPESPRNQDNATKTAMPKNCNAKKTTMQKTATQETATQESCNAKKPATRQESQSRRSAVLKHQPPPDSNLLQTTPTLPPGSPSNQGNANKNCNTKKLLHKKNCNANKNCNTKQTAAPRSPTRRPPKRSMHTGKPSKHRRSR